MVEKMSAARITHYKQDVPMIEQVDIPVIKDGDVLVKIIAASINPIDLKTKDGSLKMLLTYEMPLILGSDFAGVVMRIGSTVTDFQVGDHVYGRVQKDRIGTFADYIAVSQGDIAIKPHNLTFEEAAAVPLVGLTSYQALHDVMAIQPGQKVLIQAGSGGVGTMAIQIAKTLGAYVATTTSAKNMELVKALGADQVIDYKTENFQDILTDYDYVFDTLGGESLKHAFKIIKPGGKVVSISGLPNARFAKENGLTFWKKLVFKIASRHLTALAKAARAEYYFLFMKPSGAQLITLRHLIETNRVKPVIDRIMPFTEIAAAFKHSSSGKAKGKIILKIND